MRQLVFLEVGVNPQAVRGHCGEQLRAAADEGAGPRAAVANHPIERRANVGIAEVQPAISRLAGLRRGSRGLLLASIQHRQLTFGHGFISFGFLLLGIRPAIIGGGVIADLWKSRSTRPGVIASVIVSQFSVAAVAASNEAVEPAMVACCSWRVAGYRPARPAAPPLLRRLSRGRRDNRGRQCGSTGHLFHRHIVLHRQLLDIAGDFAGYGANVAADIGIIGGLHKAPGMPPVSAVARCRRAAAPSAAVTRVFFLLVGFIAGISVRFRLEFLPAIAFAFAQ